ncbi:MAG: hypothetical protein ACI9WO_000201 [Sphingobacteriales bacterium]|jgi:hypothetical protein
MFIRITLIFLISLFFTSSGKAQWLPELRNDLNATTISEMLPFKDGVLLITHEQVIYYDLISREGENIFAFPRSWEDKEVQILPYQNDVYFLVEDLGFFFVNSEVGKLKVVNESTTGLENEVRSMTVFKNQLLVQVNSGQREILKLNSGNNKWEFFVEPPVFSTLLQLGVLDYLILKGDEVHFSSNGIDFTTINYDSIFSLTEVLSVKHSNDYLLIELDHLRKLLFHVPTNSLSRLRNFVFETFLGENFVVGTSGSITSGNLRSLAFSDNFVDSIQLFNPPNLMGNYCFSFFQVSDSEYLIGGRGGVFQSLDTFKSVSKINLKVGYGDISKQFYINHSLYSINENGLFLKNDTADWNKIALPRDTPGISRLNTVAGLKNILIFGGFEQSVDFPSTYEEFQAYNYDLELDSFIIGENIPEDGRFKPVACEKNLMLASLFPTSGTREYIYKSNDNGRTWSQASGQYPSLNGYRGALYDTINQQYYLFGFNSAKKNIWQSSDTSKSPVWSAIVEGIEESLYSVEQMAMSKGNILSFVEAYKSDSTSNYSIYDYGRAYSLNATNNTWEPIDLGSRSLEVSGVSCTETACYVFAGEHIYQKYHNQNSYTKIAQAVPSGANANSLVQFKDDLYVGTTNLGMYRKDIFSGINFEASKLKPALEVYPNPNTGYFKVAKPMDVSAGMVRLIDLSGRVIFEKEFTSSASEIDVNLNHLHLAGIYLIQVEGQNGVQYQSKVSLLK